MMGRPSKWNEEKIIKKCKELYGGKYIISSTDYKYSEKIKIVCPIHGEFEQWFQHFLNGVGCPKCSGKIDTDDFIKKSNEIHNNKYDYSKTIYEKSNDKVIIICLEHGEFKKVAYYHLNGSGCPKCLGMNKTNEEIINSFNLIHQNKYDYSKLNYIGPQKSLTIICPKHGEFKQRFNFHLNGGGCPRCSRIINKEDFIEKSNKIHNNKYDYSNVKYIKSSYKVEIICKKHGSFYQSPNSHLRKIGCPKCNISKGEEKINNFLKNNNIIFETQKRFEKCKNINTLPFDFYLPEYNICIEFDGFQHYEKYSFEKDENRLNETRKRDNIKTNFCLKNDIKLIRIKYDECVKDKLVCLIKN